MRTWPDEFVQCVVTSPPYWGLRDYGVDGQLGAEATYQEYIDRICSIFDEVNRVLKADGTLWLNLGDCFSTGSGFREEDQKYSTLGPKRDGLPGNSAHKTKLSREAVDELKPKNLVGIPWRVALELQSRGWYLRSDIIWSKPNPMPESVKDRPTRAHEYLFLLTKSERYHYDHEAIKEPSTYGAPNSPQSIKSPQGQGFTRRADKQRGHSRRHQGFNDRWDAMTKAEQQANGRNKRSVWTVSTIPYAGAHFATFPPKLIEPCILAGSRRGDIVLDPFMGSGTTAMVAEHLGRKWIGCELNEKYLDLQKDRLKQQALAL
ncbi:MAG: site-specific DNA-methyltransferase [Bacteroidota bacterium]